MKLSSKQTPFESGSETNPTLSQANGEAMTSTPIAAGSTASLPPEFLRTSDLRAIFGLARGTVYNLAAAGKIRGVLLRVKGKKSGVRLWDVNSVRAYIRSQMLTEGEVAA